MYVLNQAVLLGDFIALWKLVDFLVLGHVVESLRFYYFGGPRHLPLLLQVIGLEVHCCSALKLGKAVVFQSLLDQFNFVNTIEFEEVTVFASGLFHFLQKLDC